MAKTIPLIENKLYYCLLLLTLLSCSTRHSNESALKEDATRNDSEIWISNFKNNYQDSSVVIQEAALHQTISDLKNNEDSKDAIAQCYNLLGTVYRRDSRYEEAIKTYELALDTQDEIILINVLNNIGVCYRRLDKLRTAAASHLEALKIIEQYEDDYENISFQHRVSLNSIGNVYLTLKQYNKALEYFDQSLALEIVANNHLGMAINYNNIGSAYQSLGDYAKAKTNYQLALRENSIINSSLGKSISFNSLGELYFIQSHYEAAMVQFDSALVYSSLINDCYHQSITHINLSKAYLQLKEYDKAWQHLETLETMAKTTNSRSIYQSLYAQLSAYYEQQGNAALALDYYRQAVNYNDSIINEVNSNYINDILSVYDTEKKGQQIALLSAKNKISSQRQKLAIAIIGLLLLALILLYYIEKERKKQQILNMGILQQQLLRSQMNPHFLFNALGSIQNFMLKNEMQKAAGFLNNFTQLTRSILEHSSQDTIILSEEIGMLENYIKLEQMRMQNSFQYHIDYDNKLEIDFIQIPPMLIQPFVENAIKHGLKHIDYPGHLHIHIEEVDNYLFIEVKDNGIGIDSAPKSSATHRSMSMQIFEKRRKLLWEKDKKPIEFSVEDCKTQKGCDKGTVVNIKFPID